MSDNTEAERLKEEERKKAEEDKSSPEKDKLKSKHSFGVNTPSHRPSKHGDPLKHSTSNTNLKRPGSPLNSEASGNESARKKQKKKRPTLSQPNAQPNNTLQPPSRPGSPLPQPAVSRKAKRPRGPGSGSDTEGGAASGGEMSDGTRKRIKLKLGQPSKNGTPQGSRSGSPDLSNATTVRNAQGISRPGSPAIPPVADTKTIPTAAEIRSLVPASGMKMNELLTHFKGQVESSEQKPQFMALLKANTRYDNSTKTLYLRPEIKKEAGV